MKEKALVFACTLLVATAAVVVAQTMSGPATDCAALKAIFDTYARAQNTDNVGIYLALWDKEAMQLRQDAPTVVGIKAIEQRVVPRFRSTTFVTMIESEEIVVTGDWGFVRGIYTQAMTPKAGGATINGAGKYLSIMKRQADGTWKIYIDHSSSSLPLK